LALNLNPPAVTAWRVVTPANTQNWVLERNPYSSWVDTEGNQLPYIDKIILDLAENFVVVNLHALAGEIDEQSRHMDPSKLPVLLSGGESWRVS